MMEVSTVVSIALLRILFALFRSTNETVYDNFWILDTYVMLIMIQLVAYFIDFVSSLWLQAMFVVTLTSFITVFVLYFS